MKVTVTGPARHRCPYVDEADIGEVELTFQVADGEDAPELHGLAARIAAWSEEVISHEQMTLALLQQTEAVRVVTRWETAGLTVEVIAP